MKKKLLLIVIFYFALIISSYGAASSGSSRSSNYDKGATIIKKGKKLERRIRPKTSTICILIFIY